jgi:uncharacterized membrane protein YeiB
MVVVHFSLVLAVDHNSPIWLAEVLGFLDGRAAATFVVLAGIGITLMSQRAIASADPKALNAIRKTLVRRGLFLLVVGFVNLIIWPGDILRVYGVSLLLGSRLITASSRNLLIIAFGFVLGFVALFYVLDFEKNWDWETLTYHGLWTPFGLLRNLFYDGFRSVFPWTGFVVFGMWLGRKNLRNKKTNTKVLLAALAMMVVTEITSWLGISLLSAIPRIDRETAKALVGTESMPPLPIFLMASGGTAVALIAMCVCLTEKWPTLYWRPLVVTGQMALTWYFGHIILGLGTVVTLGLEGAQPLPIAFVVGLLFFLLAVCVSWLWKMKFRHGPLEWVMRSVAG